ncbi:hypothetical protein [Streptomyces sp. PTD5-9]|uniref:hypothetical protein n=1 Tax=Streptomyces sp. PTD5-9 TaxID=3120150 RepID=UPI0030089AFE
MSEPIETRAEAATDAAPGQGDPAVLEHARLLAADPAGQQAVPLVFALVGAAPYVLGRRGAPVERAVVDALVSAAEALDGRAPEGAGCGHPAHPYAEALAGWGTDADALAGAPSVRTPPDARDAAEACPRNAAGWARIAADVILPGSADGIPEIVPEEHRSNISGLDEVLNDYPNGDPFWELDVHTTPPGDLSRATLAGYVVVVHAACWYAASGRIKRRSLLDDMIKGLESVLPLLPDRPCGHAEGEHPAPFRDSAQQAACGIQLQSPGGRTILREEYEDGFGPSLEAWTCTAYLRELAVEARDHLREAVARLFGAGETAHLDAEPFAARPDEEWTA